MKNFNLLILTSLNIMITTNHQTIIILRNKIVIHATLMGKRLVKTVGRMNSPKIFLTHVLFLYVTLPVRFMAFAEDHNPAIVRLDGKTRV